MNSLAFILECLFCFCIAYNFIKTVRADPGGASPKRIFAASLPIVRIGAVCNFGVRACNVTKRCLVSSKKRQAKDCGPRWEAHSALPDPLAGFKAVSPSLLCLKIFNCHQHSFQTLVNVSADFLASIGKNER